MSKRTMNLVIVVILICVLVGAYFIVNYVKSNKVIANTLEPGEVESIKIIDMPLADLMSFSLASSEPQYRLDFSRDEEGNWVYSDPSLNIESQSISSISGYVAYLSAKKVIIDSPPDLAEYGLATPKITATANFSTGEKRQLFLGDLSPTGDVYYMMIDGDSKVYAVPKYTGDSYLKTLNDLVVKELPLIDAKQSDIIDFFYLKAKDKEPVEVVLDYKGDELMEYGVSGYIVEKPYAKRQGSSDAFLSVYADALLNLKIKDYISNDESDLEKYGFNDPSLELKAITTPHEETKEVKIVNLVFGDMANETDIYFKKHNENVIYTMDKSLVQVYLDYKPFDFVNRFLALINIKKLDSMTIKTYGENSQEFKTEIKHETNIKDDGTEEILDSFFYNDKQIDDSTYRTFYQLIIGFLADTFLNPEDVPADNTQPEITVSYKITGIEQERVVNFVSITDTFYAGGVNGDYSFSINKRYVDEAIKRAFELKEEYN